MLNRFKTETSNYVHVTSSVILCLISGVSMDQLGCSAQLCLKRTKIIGFMAPVLLMPLHYKVTNYTQK